MFNSIRNNLIVPVLSRAGTFVASLLVGYGVHGDTATQVGTGVVAVGLVLADLVSDWLIRRNVANKAAL